MRKRRSSADRWASNSDLQVVGHEPVAPRERSRALGLESPGPDRQRGEVETRGPTLRVLGELGDVDIRQLHAGRAQELARLRFVHAQVVRPDLQRQATRPQRCQRERRWASRREGHLRPLRDVSRECLDGVEAGRVIEEVKVVQDQDALLAHLRQSRSQTRHDRRLDRNAGQRQRVEHARVEPRDAVERDCDIGQQDDRIVVPFVDGYPRERSLRPGGPLSEQRRLPPAGAGGQENEPRRARAFQRADELCARHGRGGALRRQQLRLEQLERRRRGRGSTYPAGPCPAVPC